MTLADVAELKAQLVNWAGGYLRNVGGPDTCERCFTPTPDSSLCRKCTEQLEYDGQPDALGFMTYAGKIEPIAQTHHMMYSYKSPNVPEGAAYTTVRLLTGVALKAHRLCATRLVGHPLTAWATVPSLREQRPGQHKLNKIVGSWAKPDAVEYALTGQPSERAKGREVDAAHFTVEEKITGTQHVLMIDDSWVTGGNVMSATLALRNAGAKYVSVLALARWLSEKWEPSVEWARRHLKSRDYSTDICPWTQGPCP